MARVKGATRQDVDTYANLLNTSLDAHMRQVMTRVANGMHGTITLDDLGPIMALWRPHAHALVGEVERAYGSAVGITRRNQRNALITVLSRRSALMADAGDAQDTQDPAVTVGTSVPGGFEIPVVVNRAAESLLADAENRLVNIGNVMWAHAREELLTGLQNGEGERELQARVQDSTQLAAPRAQVIARSEIGRAMNQGSIAQMQQVNAPVTKTWIGIDDGRERPEHLEMNDVSVGLNDTFPIGFDPGDDYNCRCTLGFDMPDDQFADGTCGCGDGETAIAAGALVAAGDDLGAVCACTVDAADQTDQSMRAPDDIYKEYYAKAQAKIANAPVPSKEAVAKAQQELANARAGVGRAGGEARGGSAAARRKQRLNLFNEFGGEEHGYATCHSCGLKLHWADPGSADNPHGYARLERGKIFVKCQGGGYQLPNLLPECFSCNRSRNDKMIREDNRC